MGQESNVDGAVVSKLLIDRPSDFRFHAAYLVYSLAWEKSASQDIKSRLNEMIASLSKDEIDYETFYGRISRYRAELNPEQYHVGTRARIETQRKRDWRRREAKNARDARHGRR